MPAVTPSPETPTPGWVARLLGRGSRVEQLRRWIFWILVLGLAGTETELILLSHYDEPLQWVPLVLVPLAFATLVWNAKRNNAASRRALQALMMLFVLAGFAGVGLHFRGAAEFQLETDPTIARWDLVKKVLRAQTPPVLAPGVMLQLGLLGLVFAWTGSRSKEGETQ